MTAEIKVFYFSNIRRYLVASDVHVLLTTCLRGRR